MQKELTEEQKQANQLIATAFRNAKYDIYMEWLKKLWKKGLSEEEVYKEMFEGKTIEQQNTHKILCKQDIIDFFNEHPREKQREDQTQSNLQLKEENIANDLSTSDEEYYLTEEELNESAEAFEQLERELKESQIHQNEEKTSTNGLKLIKDEDLEDYPNQPFKPYTEEKKEELIESIKINGIIHPIVVRPIIKEDGTTKYQILSGHNRRICGRECGIKEFECKVVEDLSDKEAECYLVDTNLAQRENLSPMEKARALKMRKDAYKSEKIKKRIEGNLENENIDEKLRSYTNMSNGNIQRYLRLNELTSSLQEVVDDGKISLKVAENLSFLSKPMQNFIGNLVNEDSIKISETQSKRLKENNDIISKDFIKEMFSKDKKDEEKTAIIIKFKVSELSDFFENIDTEEIKNTIIEALKFYKNNENNT